MVVAAPRLNFQTKQATLPVRSFVQRLLLVTDGELTDIVQAYAGELVTTSKLNQKLVIDGSPASALNLEREYQLLISSTVLQGQETGINYLYAEAEIVLERLDSQIRDQLIFGNQPMGQILQINKLETYREILDCGCEKAGELADHFGVEPDSQLIYRTYLILINGLPVMKITEKFPASHFVD